ncbi:hypothetical protein NL469_28440, partial [Klebsiella pneumoniae]|nr:hypothetical protein [Klebsiella pneumoniae]
DGFPLALDINHPAPLEPQTLPPGIAQPAPRTHPSPHRTGAPPAPPQAQREQGAPQTPTTTPNQQSKNKIYEAFVDIL